MINNEIGRDERVHLNEHDIIANESATTTTGETSVTRMRPWPQTKSDSLLQDAQTQDEKPSKSLCNKIQGAIFPMIVLGIILGLVVMLFIINSSGTHNEVIPYTCDTPCSVSIVESIPENLTYNAGAPTHNSTYSAWKELITSANESLYIASMYWTLRNKETGTSSSTASEGEEIFTLLQDALRRGVQVKIVGSMGFGVATETDILSDLGAEVRYLNFTKLFKGGVLHTKFIISDMRGFYVGSANMDWRSLTQVKEMGVHVAQCSCLIVEDLYKIFEIYWAVGNDSTIPTPLPAALDTHYNISYPLQMGLGDNDTANVSLSSSPKEFCTKSRTVDLDAILAVMNDAKKYVYIAVMDYYPTTLYRKPASSNIYWPDIDDTIRKIVFEQDVEVRLLASYWNDTKPIMLNYLRSLDEFSDRLHVKVFVVPTYGDEVKIPFSRVNHNKYMVTDRVAYIGTSNWSGDYFIDTAGVGMIFNQSDASADTMTIRQQLTQVFLRDWESDYSHNVTSDLSSLIKRA